MIGWIGRAVFMFFILSVIYIALTILNRLKQREHLKAEYAETDHSEPADEFIAEGMDKYNRSLRAKLILGVYLVPFAAFGLLMYLALYT